MPNKRKRKAEPKTLGARIRKSRLDAGHTPDYLAKILNVKTRYILDIEENKIEVPLDFLYKIAVHCNTTVSEIKPPEKQRASKGYL